MQAAIAMSPGYAEAYFMLGTALKQKGDLDAAAAALRTAVRLDPTNPGPYNTLAQVLRQKGDIEGSRQAFAEGARMKEKKETELGKMLQKRPASSAP
jgi:cytochrome c-type biogenesis protein CcmH/NrfG